MNHDDPLVIGITPGWMHADEDRTRYNGRPLLFVEQSMAEWLMRHGGITPMMIPASDPENRVSLDAADYAGAIDGLVLQGGVDVAPESYGEEPLQSEWAGDRIRDRWELQLVDECLRRDRPILGICRGHQLLNVALGGSLFQDIATQIEGALNHRDPQVYHELTHQVVFESGTQLRRLFGGDDGIVNSVHHQAVKALGDGLVVEARSPKDGVVEAVRYDGPEYAFGLQWHPEFQTPQQTKLLPTAPLLEDFVNAVRCRRG